MDFPFPADVSFIQEGRDLEVEAVHPGRRSNELTTAPSLTEDDDLDESAVAFTAMDDIMETNERSSLLNRYLPYVQMAFRQRGLLYPFRLSPRGDSLAVVPDSKPLAEACAQIGGMVSKDNADGQRAKEFEKRAVRALHRFIGGWSVCVGAPREGHTGCERAVREFRSLIPEERGDFFRPANQAPPVGYPPAGDFGADAFSILGRTWGGPLIFLQAKNAPFSIRNIPGEFQRISDVLLDWFGKRINRFRIIIPVFAVNTIFTRDLKEGAFQGAQPVGGYHIIDAADILHAEQHPDGFPDGYHQLNWM